MRETINTCHHCGSKYNYYLSGAHSSDYRINDDRFCRDCMVEMLKVLAKIPVKFKKVWIDASDEITLDELYEAEKHDTRLTRRIFPSLMSSNDSYSTREIKVNGISYFLTEWNNFNEYEIRREVRWNLIDDIAESLSDNKSRVSKKLFNPNKSDTKPEPMRIEAVKPLDNPVGLAHMMRFACDPTAIWNQELNIALGDEHELR